MADQNDFDAFYNGSVNKLAGQLYLVTGDREEARDCVQEAFERAWLRWDTVRHADAPEAWVRTVARRLAVSRWRKARNALTAWQRESGGSEDGFVRGGDPGAGSTDRLALVAALQQLPVAQRTAIVLHHLCDLDVNAVAAETGATASAVKSQLARGRRTLAGLLDDPRIDEPGSPPRQADVPLPSFSSDIRTKKVTP